MAIHPAFVLTCDGYQCAEKLALIGPNAVSYHGARSYAESYGWDCSSEDLDWCPACHAGQTALDTDVTQSDICHNRHYRRPSMVVVIDSDKKSSRAALNASKRRVIDELSADPDVSLAWVTAGYTIENYVPEDTLTAAIHAAHPRSSASMTKQDRYGNPLASDRIGIKNPSKVAIAKQVADVSTDQWPFRLKRDVQAVIDLIDRANHHL